MPSDMFFDSLTSDFQNVSNLLSETALAGYLLAYDASREECRAIIRSDNRFAFAEGDDDEERAVRIGGKAGLDLRFDVPPQEAIDFFKRKKILSADKFYELEAEARSGAFALADVYKTDVTAALRQELVDALQNGTPQREVIKRLQSILEGSTGQKVLGPNHLETVFRTTTQMAYGVGRRIAQEESKDYLPIWEYSAVGDDRTRPTHMALDGLQYPVDHPFWGDYYPPWDFRCRCSVIPRLEYSKGYKSSARVTWPSLPASGFRGIPPQANLRDVLKSGADRALDGRRI
jgi:SPP1 gp7 family putative phage head morphogenesis protein